MVVCSFLICGDFLSTGHPVLEGTMVLFLSDLALEGQNEIIAAKTHCSKGFAVWFLEDIRSGRGPQGRVQFDANKKATLFYRGRGIEDVAGREGTAWERTCCLRDSRGQEQGQYLSDSLCVWCDWVPFLGLTKCPVAIQNPSHMA